MKKKSKLLTYIFYLFLAVVISVGCKEKADPNPPPPVSSAIVLNTITMDNITANSTLTYNISRTVTIKLSFDNAVKRTTVPAAIKLTEGTAGTWPVNINYERGDSVVVVTPASPLKYLTSYNITVSTSLASVNGGRLYSESTAAFFTQIDSSRKFPPISDAALLDLVQQQTFKYFWDYGHPVSGLARERSNGDDNVVTSGGSGFGIMTIPVAIQRSFITRVQGLQRMQTIVGFLKNTAVKVKGAFPHWLNGSTGAIIPFSANDNGADLVETSYLMMGLLTARQYFNGSDAAELALRSDINALYNAVEWDWFRQNGTKTLYWHYSPSVGFAMNMPIQGWNECLITYVLAASSTTHGIPKAVYDSGFARNGGMANNNTYYTYQLPLGPALGGPLFFEHYSFLGIKPTGLADAYANYATQTGNHTKINYTYCKTNPRNYFGYSDSVWGLTASDIPNGYTASSPTNDVGVIAPTASLSSMPYTPAESMAALKFYYYVLGDKLWKQYGFVDAFSLHKNWFAPSFLAIDQGPIIVMIENYRTGLLWNLFTSCPEVKSGMQSLGFTAPWL